jgi:ribonuclease HII
MGVNREICNNLIKKSMIERLSADNLIEAGCDEAGRGCLAGPVVAAAVIFPPGYFNPEIVDSKKLSASKRDILRLEIEQSAVTWAIGMADNNEIDSLNILNASFLAMHRALSGLLTLPEHIIIDGNRFTCYRNIPHTCIVKGDSLYLSIAAASILAKTHRDKIMADLDKEFPHYGWFNNKGYPTDYHICALDQHGPSPLHRRSFKIKREFLANGDKNSG